jgi:hypothetical protein
MVEDARMHLGNGIKESAAEKLVAKAKPELLEGEAVGLICKCNNFKPMVDRVLLTNARLLAVSAADAKVRFSAGRQDVVAVVVESGWAGTTLAITQSDGTKTVFKSMDESDAETLRTQLESVGTDVQAPHDAVSTEHVASVGTADPEDGEQSGALAKFGATMKRAYGEAQAASEQLAESNSANYGALVKKGQFGLKTVEIYDAGYVRVGLLLTQKSQFEKLKSIKFSLQVQDRSGIGHLWASGGMGSKEKRVLLLTIATDKEIHTLSTEGEMGRSEDKVGLALEAAGNSVIADLNREPSPTVITHAAPEATIGERLRQIADLHHEGVLSDEEFATAKAKLLEQL